MEQKAEYFRSGDIAIVMLPVKVVFRHSDKIVVDVDEYGNPDEFRSGLVMDVFPGQTLVHEGQSGKYIASTMIEKSPQDDDPVYGSL